jgi:hypothetical protein
LSEALGMEVIFSVSAEAALEVGEEYGRFPRFSDIALARVWVLSQLVLTQTSC